MSNDFWGDRYTQEGFIWGNEPSLTAQFLEKALPKVAKIFEVGFGYGRDLVYLANIGHSISGIENSPIAVQKAQKQLEKNEVQSANLIQGDFTQATLLSESVDVVYSHRTIHLLQDQHSIERFADQAAHILKSSGLLYISARDHRGVPPQREGHHVSFWDEDRFKAVFGVHFEILQFVEGEEVESASNPEPTYFTLMVARKKAGQKIIPTI